MDRYDAIIIGSGQAGTPLAFKLASENKKVAFIEKNKFGGTCLNVGCTPTKAYVASARRMWDVQHGEELGISIPQGATANLRKIKERKDQLIKKSVDGIAKAVEENSNIQFINGIASFLDSKTLVVNESQITAEQIFINVGGRPRIPDGFADIPYLTNESILELEEIPGHLIIIGGSYIGLEFGQMFRRFGSKVTIIDRNERLIKREDEETSEAIMEFMEEEGVDFRLKANCLSGALNNDKSITVKVDCALNGEPTVTGTHVLLAAGRQPNTDSLNLSSTKIKTTDRGFIEVNDYLETSVKGVYALGDCNGLGAFTHTAYNDFEIIAENMFSGKDRKVSDRIVTYGLFTDPPLGRAGITRRQALEKGYKILTGYRPMTQIARAREKGETNGFMSIVIDAKSHKILGASILGVGGDEVISSILNIMYADIPYEVIRDSIQPHPTISELVPTMLENLKEA